MGNMKISQVAFYVVLFSTTNNLSKGILIKDLIFESELSS